MSALYIFLIIAGFCLLLYLAGGFALAIILFVKGRRNNDQIVEYEVKEKKFDIKLLDIPCVEYNIYSRFGYRLHARFYKAEKETNKYIIDIHGRSSSSISQLKYLSIFQQMGYNVLLPDQRNSGQSGFSFFSYGAYEKYDVMSWISTLKRKDPKAEIILFGESMGAATAVLVTAMDDRVKGLISYCSYSSVTDIIKSHLGKQYPSSLKFFLPAFNIVSLFLFGMRVWQINVAKQMEKVKVKTFIIHSYGDKLLDITHARKLIAANDKAEYLLFEGDEHAKSICNHKEEFTVAVQEFLKKL